MIKTNSRYKIIVNALPKEEIIKLYIEKKLGSSAIAKRYGCLSGHILNLLKENNVPILKINNLPKNEIIELYKKNYSVREIARKYNLGSTGPINRILDFNNIIRQTKLEKINKEECIKLYKEGATLSRLASIYGTHLVMIKKFLNDNKVLIRTKRVSKRLTAFIPGFNSKACAYFYLFDKFNNTNGHYAPHEYYIKELGFFPDYINFELKLIMEWDENHHTYQKEIDKEREQKIKSIFQDFKFVRINESDVEKLF